MTAQASGSVPHVPNSAEVIGPPPDRTCAVTVFVETYNHAAFIADCLAGILTQRFSQRFRVVVNDDASTDGTADILRRIQAENPDRVQLILQRENQLSQGVAVSDHILTTLVTPYVAFCEGDDQWIDATKLERQWRFMQRNPWCALSHHEIEIESVESTRDYAESLRRYLRTTRPDRERVPGLQLLDGNWIMTCSVMIRTAAIPRTVAGAIGAREPSDFILFALVAAQGDIGFLPQSMSRYRLHGANFWSTKPQAERASRELEALWFLAGHLTGAAARRIRERLLEVLAMDGSAVAFTAFRRMRVRDHELLRDRDILLDRVRYLEEREIELVHALGWDVDQP